MTAVNKIVCRRTDQCDMLTTISRTVHPRGWACMHEHHFTHFTRAIHLLKMLRFMRRGCWNTIKRRLICRCANPAYPLSPTRCWHYRFSYLDFGGDCGWGRCKKPSEARCLPRCQSPRLGSRRLNPLLNSHIHTENDSPRWKKKCWRRFVLESHKKAKLEGSREPQTDRSACQRSKEHKGLAGRLHPQRLKTTLWFPGCALRSSM